MILLIDFDSLDFCAYFSKPMPVELNEERQINETDYYFKLNYNKKSNKNEALYVFYDLQKKKVRLIDSESSHHMDILLVKMNLLIIF